MVRNKKIIKKNNKNKKNWFDIIFYTVSAIVIVILLFIGLRQRGLLPALWIDDHPSPQIALISDEIRERRANFDIINAHEHVQSEKNLPLLRKDSVKFQ